MHSYANKENVALFWPVYIPVLKRNKERTRRYLHQSVLPETTMKLSRHKNSEFRVNDTCLNRRSCRELRIKKNLGLNLTENISHVHIMFIRQSETKTRYRLLLQHTVRLNGLIQT